MGKEKNRFIHEYGNRGRELNFQTCLPESFLPARGVVVVAPLAYPEHPSERPRILFLCSSHASTVTCLSLCITDRLEI